MDGWVVSIRADVDNKKQTPRHLEGEARLHAAGSQSYGSSPRGAGGAAQGPPRHVQHARCSTVRRWQEGEGGGNSRLLITFASCLTIDHALRSRRSTVPTPDKRHLQHLGAYYSRFVPYITLPVSPFVRGGGAGRGGRGGAPRVAWQCGGESHPKRGGRPLFEACHGGGAIIFIF